MAGAKPEPNAKMTIPRVARIALGAAAMTSDPIAKKATEVRLMRRSLPGALIPRITRNLLRAGSTTRSKARFMAARSVIKMLAYV